MPVFSTWVLAGVLMGPVEVEWQAPAGCASAEVVVAEVERLLAGREPKSTVRVRAAVVKDRAGVAGTVEIAAAAPRRLRAGSCEALAQAVAVVIAVAVDPAGTSGGAAAPRGDGVVPAPPAADAKGEMNSGASAGGESTPGAAGASGVSATSAGGVAAGVNGESATNPSGAAAPGAAGVNGESATSAGGAGAPAGVNGESATGAGGVAANGVAGESRPDGLVALARAGKGRPPVWHAVGVRGGALIGASDFPTAGVGLTYSLERGLLRVEARVMYATPRRITYDDVRDGVGARVQAVTLGALACVSPGNSTARVPMCLGAEGGPLIGEGIGVANGQTRASLWASGLLTVAAVGRVSRRFNLIVAAEFAAALRRPAFHVGEREVLVRSRAFGARILLGFEIVFGR